MEVRRFIRCLGNIATQLLPDVSLASYFSFQGVFIALVFLGAMVGVFAQAEQWAAFHGYDTGAVRCADNSACVGLVGDCCPTAAMNPSNNAGVGVTLGCCRDPDNVATRHFTEVGACDDNSACAALGLSGMCCGPENSLVCCSDLSNEVRILLLSDYNFYHRLRPICFYPFQNLFLSYSSSGSALMHSLDDHILSHTMGFIQVRKPHTVVAACSGNSACHFAGITGNCCPTDDGTILGCCPPGSEKVGSNDDDDEIDGSGGSDSSGRVRRRITLPFLEGAP
jgi:hypothetical protein